MRTYQYYAPHALSASLPYSPPSHPHACLQQPTAGLYSCNLRLRDGTAAKVTGSKIRLNSKTLYGYRHTFGPVFVEYHSNVKSITSPGSYSRFTGRLERF